MRCVHRDTDRYGRMVALCSVEGIDIGQWIVQQGQAIAFRKYSLDYVAEEDRARAAKVGLRESFRTRPTSGARTGESRLGHLRGVALVAARMTATAPAGGVEGEAVICGCADERQRARCRADADRRGLDLPTTSACRAPSWARGRAIASSPSPTGGPGNERALNRRPG